MEEKRATAVFGKVESGLAAVQLAAAGMGTADGLTSFGHKVWRGRWIPLWLSVAFALLALMLQSLQLPLYREQTSIEIQSPERGGAPSKADAQDGAHAAESYLQTQIRIIESRTLLEHVLSKLTEAEKGRLLETRHFWWTRTSYDQALESLRKRISAQPSEQAGIVDISFLSPDPAAGAHFLNLLTQELADFNVEREWRALQHNRQWADRQLDDVRRKWEQSEQLLAEYSQASAAGMPRPQPVPARVNSTRPPSPSKSLNESNDPKLRQLRDKLADLNKQVAQWEALYGPAGANVQKLKSQAAAAEAAIRQRRAVLQQTVVGVPAAARPVVAVEARPAPPYPQTAHLHVLEREVESNRLSYETTASRLKEATLTSASQLPEISVVDPAIPAVKPATPSQWLTGLLAASAGLLTGIAFLALRDRFSNTFTEPSLLGQYLGLQVLGAVPLDSLGEQEKTYNPETQEPGLHLNFDTNIRTAEAFRSIRSSILLRTGQRAGPRRLLFTSAGFDEGKTFVVSNLGAALASAQRRVLLVDGNLRNPSLHKIFGADNEHGLADLLSRQILDHPIATRDVIRETQIPDLYLLSAGQAGTNAPEILSSAQLPQLLREFAKGFDLVLLDSAPILLYADARSLAGAADAVVLIVKAGSTDRHAALQARDAAGQDGAAIMGTILTEWDAA